MGSGSTLLCEFIWTGLIGFNGPRNTGFRLLFRFTGAPDMGFSRQECWSGVPLYSKAVSREHKNDFGIPLEKPFVKLKWPHKAYQGV